MPLVTLKEILKGTREKGIAIGGFNFNGYEDAQGIVNGASEKQAPVILMASTGAVRYLGLKQTVYMVRAMAESVLIPVCLHLDHATDIELIKECVRTGFTSVMIDASKKSYEENIRETREVVAFAERYGCSVEAELGKIGGREEEIYAADGEELTDPDDVPDFVSRTGLDALAVAIGTAHGFYKKEPKIDFDRLRAIAGITKAPLVLHGGTGVPAESFQKAIRLGMSKINVGTELKAAYTDAVKNAIRVNPDEIDPRKIMGPVKDKCSRVVQEKIELFGCAGRS